MVWGRVFSNEFWSRHYHPPSLTFVGKRLNLDLVSCQCTRTKLVACCSRTGPAIRLAALRVRSSPHPHPPKTMRTTLAACTLLVAVADASPRDRAPPAVQEDSSCHGPVIRVTTATAEALARVVESAASVWKVSGREATINVPPGGTAEVSALPGVIGVTVQVCIC
eukprot:SAG31_NODE_1778_length_7297_cov_10.330786_2_plen_166_part_00